MRNATDKQAAAAETAAATAANSKSATAAAAAAAAATSSSGLAAALAQRKLTQRLLIELLVLMALIIPICICEFALEPAQRGFFCDDESIRYPFRGNTVTMLLLGLMVGALPLCILLLVEYRRHCRGVELNTASVPLFGWQLSTWHVELCKQFAYFNFGLLLTLNATEVGKFTMGRLRPHFVAVCQPQLLDGSRCSDARNAHRYVEDYVCVGGDGFSMADVRQARLSFPSGHSSLACYAMLYVALYLQRRLSWRSCKLARHFVQFVLLMLAWFTALSRVMDYWHHWSDVLAGMLIGVAGALITARYIARFFDSHYGNVVLGISDGCLRRENTSATLHEVCSPTPPPYCVMQL